MVLRHNVVLKTCVLIFLATALRPPALLAAAGGSGGVTGLVFLDKNGDGVRDAGEPGFSGIVVTLFGKKSDGSALYLATRTDSEGKFAFAGAMIGDGGTFRVSAGGVPLAATIPTTYHPARTFYTATNGDDTNPGSREQPFRTIGHAVPILQDGDLLYIRQGEYREYISSMKRPLGGGSGWDRPVVVAGLPGETVVVRPPDREGDDFLVTLALQRQQYIVFDNLVLDAEGVTLPLRSQSRDGKEPPPNHVRVINCELLNSRASGVFVAGEDHQFINCRVHDNGHGKQDHGLHVGGGHNLVQGCDIYRNAGCGISLYNPSEPTASNNVICGNRVHDNGLYAGYGIGLHTGEKNLVYDNLIWGNPFGIVVSDNGSEESLLNNTVTRSRGPGIAISSDVENRDGVLVKATHGNVVRNNIVIGNRDPNLGRYSQSSVYDHNLIDGDPLFRDPEANDFHLLPNSPAIDAGATIAEVQSDHDGISRPQGKAYDLGAYEYTEDSFVPTTSTYYSSSFVPGKTYRVIIGFTLKKK